MAPRPRKRVRRRRLAENFDDSSDSSSPSSSSSASSRSHHSLPKTTNKSSSDSSESSSESDSSSSSSSSSGSSLNRPTAKRGRLAKKQSRTGQQQQKDEEQGILSTETILRSPSPVAQSPPAPLPSSFFDPDLALPYLDSPPDFSLPAEFETRPATRQVDALQSARQQLAQDEDKFRGWYISTIVDRFPNELDQLRSTCNPQEANSNLDLLVAALGSGVDMFDDSITLSSAPLVSHQTPPSSKIALDDHNLVLESLDLAAQRNTHLDPSLCQSDHSQASQSEDIEMDS